MNDWEWTKNQNALRLAYKAHETLYTGSKDGKQWRKWANPPRAYYHHVFEVACLAAQHPKSTPLWFRAGALHDTLEDTRLSEKEIVAATDEETLDWVRKLTNPSKQHPDKPRKWRKEHDRAHWAEMVTGCPDLCSIKFIDRRCNIREMHGAPAGFMKLYIEESRLLADAMKPADEAAYVLLMADIDEAEKAAGEVETHGKFFGNYLNELATNRVRLNDLYLAALRQILANQTRLTLDPQDAMMSRDLVSRIDGYLQFNE